MGHLPSPYLEIIHRRVMRQEPAVNNAPTLDRIEDDHLSGQRTEKGSPALTGQWQTELDRRVDRQLSKTEAMLESMDQAEHNLEFKGRLSTIEQWFEVMSESELCAALASLNELLNDRLDRILDL